MDTVLHQEEQNKKKGIITSAIFHIILLILCVLPLLTFPDPPPGQPSVAISFGEPDVGQGEEEPAPAPIAEATEEVPETEEPAEVEEPEEVVEEKEVKEVKKEKPKTSKDDSKKLADESKARKLAREKKKKADAAKKAKADAAAAAAKAKKAKADAAKKAKADAAAKAAADAKKKADAKNKFKDMFNGGQGTGDDSQGNSGTPGNAGNPDGDPDATVLSGEGTGNGDVSGFGNRGYKSAGKVEGNFQEVGTVRLEICVDRTGKVTSAKQKLSGSTTQSATLRKLAIRNAKNYKFDKSDQDNQCGFVTYYFKLQ